MYIGNRNQETRDTDPGIPWILTCPVFPKNLRSYLTLKFLQFPGSYIAGKSNPL